MSVRELQHTKGCWTCKDRKVRCDRVMPVCGVCARSRRECLGYGTRLTWPKHKVDRRSLTIAPSSNETVDKIDTLKSRHFVNLTYWHFHTYSHIVGSTAHLPPSSELHKIDPYETWPHRGYDSELLLYFKLVVYKSVAPFASLDDVVPGCLVRTALDSDSVASSALRLALMALACIHRDGYHYTANKLKVQAITNLRFSMKEEEKLRWRATRLISACVLLCCFETFLPSESSFQWPEYLVGAKQIFDTMELHDTRFKPDWSLSVCAGWIYYHDVLALFSLQHWKKSSPGATRLIQGQKTTVRHLVLGDKTKMLDLLQNVFELTSRFSSSVTVSRSDLEELAALTHKLNTLRQDAALVAETGKHQARDVAELYRLSALIYLQRCSGQAYGPTGSDAIPVADALAIIRRLDICERAFPLAVIGCEARSDEDRLAILNIITQTQDTARVRSYSCIRRLVETCWNLNDLDEDQSLSYMTKMSLAITNNDYLPSFS